MNARKRIVVVGGVAGGASCAARVRRLSEDSEIIVFERGPYVSFANCGLPYYVGDIIQKEDKLLVATAELFKTRFNIEVRTEHEVIAIDRERQEIQVRNLRTGASYGEPYDALVLAPGAAPIRPRLPGIDLLGIFTLRTIPDSRDIRQWIAESGAKTAVVVGAGFIGLEMAENLVQRGLTVAVVEMLGQVLPPLDPELAELVRQRLVEKGVSVHLNDAVASFERDSSGNLVVRTQSGTAIPAGLVVLGLGVRPEIQLAKQAGLAIGEKNGIRVDDSMRTSDPNIWAVGDAVESRDFVTREWCVVPLAGPANRQGRIAADSICGRTAHFRGVQSTAVCGVFGLTVAMTGASEKTLNRCGITGFDKVYLHPNDHVTYYPGAKPIHMKLLFSRDDGRVLGAQAVGEEGVERRIDVIAMAIQKGATTYDLEEADLCYAPQFGSAKDAVNFAGMVASNVRRGDVALACWEQVPGTQALLLDVREPSEFKDGHVEGAVNIPLPQLRARLGEVPADREIWVYCAAGQRSYYALRILRQHGYSRVRNLSGGFTTYKQFQPALQKTKAAAGVTE
jgi:NADPH-dependent 2,4-dienoyl-CoA reductase/sulfur reductase-like enzyme/rhodanese-related sulfurtransferase